MVFTFLQIIVLLCYPKLILCRTMAYHLQGHGFTRLANLSPLFFAKEVKLSHGDWMKPICSHRFSHLNTDNFDWIQVWTLIRPFQFIKELWCKPSHCSSGFRDCLAPSIFSSTGNVPVFGKENYPHCTMLSPPRYTVEAPIVQTQLLKY